MSGCLQMIASLDEANGGPSRSVSALCDALAANDLVVTLAAQKVIGLQNGLLVVPQNNNVATEIIDAYRVLKMTFSPFYKANISSLVKNNNIKLIHSNGLWLQCNRVAASVSKQQGLPHIVSPRGMLQPKALSFHGWKKKPVWFLWQKRALQEASLFCATAQHEADGIRALGFKQPIAIIPHGVDLPVLTQSVVHNSTELKTALFLGRIHPIKGLEYLIQAWKTIKPVGWKCVIAGPSEEGYEAVIKKAVNDAGLNDHFEFAGPVYGAKKALLMQSADLFVLPTHTENFGIAIAEALAFGVPVITTKGAPWECLVTSKCGWWIDVGAKPLEQTLREAFDLPRTKLQEMGRLGRVLVENEFSWQQVGASMKSVYDWILCGGKVPDCVRLD